MKLFEGLYTIMMVIINSGKSFKSILKFSLNSSRLLWSVLTVLPSMRPEKMAEIQSKLHDTFEIHATVTIKVVHCIKPGEGKCLGDAFYLL